MSVLSTTTAVIQFLRGKIFPSFTNEMDGWMNDDDGDSHFLELMEV